MSDNAKGMCIMYMNKDHKGRGNIMKNWDDVVDFLQEKNLLGRNCCLKKEEEKKSNIWVWILAIVGGIAVIAGIAYAVYRYLTPDYIDEFDDDFDDDFEDDFFDDEEEESEKEDKKTE